MFKRCVAKFAWNITERYSTLDFLSSFTKQSIQLNFNKNSFRCSSVFVGFICYLPRKVMISSKIGLFNLFSLFRRSHVSGSGYQRFPSISVYSWNNWFRMRSHSSGWLFTNSTCACGTGIVFAACCGFITMKLATTTHLWSVYVVLQGLVTCNIVFPSL